MLVLMFIIFKLPFLLPILFAIIHTRSKIESKKVISIQDHWINDAPREAEKCNFESAIAQLVVH